MDQLAEGGEGGTGLAERGRAGARRAAVGGCGDGRLRLAVLAARGLHDVARRLARVGFGHVAQLAHGDALAEGVDQGREARIDAQAELAQGDGGGHLGARGGGWARSLDCGVGQRSRMARGERGDFHRLRFGFHTHIARDIRSEVYGIIQMVASTKIQSS